MGCSGIPVPRIIHTIYSDTLNLSQFSQHRSGPNDELAYKLLEKMDLLRSKQSTALGDLEELNLFTQSSYMLDHFVEDIERSEYLRHIYASYFKHFISTGCA